VRQCYILFIDPQSSRALSWLEKASPNRADAD